MSSSRIAGRLHAQESSCSGCSSHRQRRRRSRTVRLHDALRASDPSSAASSRDSCSRSTPRCSGSTGSVSVRRSAQATASRRAFLLHRVEPLDDTQLMIWPLRFFTFGHDAPIDGIAIVGPRAGELAARGRTPRCSPWSGRRDRCSIPARSTVCSSPDITSPPVSETSVPPTACSSPARSCRACTRGCRDQAEAAVFVRTKIGRVSRPNDGSAQEHVAHDRASRDAAALRLCKSTSISARL